MKEKQFQSFNKDLSMNTKAYVLLALILVGYGYIFDNIEEGFAFISLIAILIVLLFENILLLATRHPAKWNIIKWTFLLIIISFILIGATFG